MSASFLVLAIPASVAFVCIVWHSAKMRGVRTTVAFFAALIGFGLLRGNLVYWITNGKPPYRFEMSVMTVGRTGVVEAMGWCIAVYISWSIAERLLAGRKPHEDNLLVQLLFSCSMMMGFALLMETAAGRMDWWHWSPPRGMKASPALRDVERGITEWFSVGFDFLTPWLLFTSARLKNRAWALLGLIPFPVHFGFHEIRRVVLDHGGIHLSQKALEGQHLIKLNRVSHFAMLAVAVILPYFLFVARRPSPDYRAPLSTSRETWIARLDVIALGIVVLTVATGLFGVAKEGELVIFALPVLAAGLYAWWWSERRAPV